MYASDVEQSDGARASDRSGVTTDDEFFNEMMDAPPEFEDRLIPDQCKNEIEGLEHLTKCLNRRFNAYPVVFMGTLKEALKEAFSQKEISERRPLLFYVNNDKSVYTNLFCKQLLCNEKMIEYLMNNYVLWAWDITFEFNERKFTFVRHYIERDVQSCFSTMDSDKQFNTNSIDQYPLLIGVFRDVNGDYTFKRLVEGSNKKLTFDEFLASLIEFKDHFELSEKQFEKAKEDAKQQMLLNLFQSRDLRRSKYHNDRDFLRSVSMLPSGDYDRHFNPRHPRYTRVVSGDPHQRPHPSEFLASNFLSKEDLMRTFEELHADSDEADDEDDDDGRTPTVNRPAPKFP